MKRKNVVIYIMMLLSVFLISIPSYSSQTFYIKNLDSLIIADTNMDKYNELIAAQENKVLILSLRSGIKTMATIHIPDSIRGLYYVNRILYIFTDSYKLYTWNFDSSKPALQEMIDLKSKIDLIYDIHINKQGNPCIVGSKKISDFPYKCALYTLEFSKDKKYKLTQVATIDQVHTLLGQYDEVLKYIVAYGGDDDVEKIAFYEYSNNQLKNQKTYRYSLEGFQFPHFFYTKGQLYVQVAYEVPTDKCGAIFKFDIVRDKFIKIVDVPDPIHSLIIGDLNIDGKLDMIWTDENTLHVKWKTD